MIQRKGVAVGDHFTTFIRDLIDFEYIVLNTLRSCVDYFTFLSFGDLLWCFYYRLVQNNHSLTVSIQI